MLVHLLFVVCLCVGTYEFCLFAGTSVGLFVMSECAGTSVVCGVFVCWNV